jgi:DEAD/DEAH box helicase domain-containing protein
VVVDRTETEKVIAEVDFSSACETLHEKAIYILEGEQYIVEEFDYQNRKAYVKKSNADYFTDSINYTKIATLDIFDETRNSHYNSSCGDVHVFSQIVGFKKLKFFTNENVGAGDLQLPQQEFHTTAFWITIKNELLNRIDIKSEEKLEAITGIAYLMRHLSAVLLMCDVKDIGVAVEDNLTGTEINLNTYRKFSTLGDQSLKQAFEPNIYIYDNYPNGIGFSEILYEKTIDLLHNVVGVIEKCYCSRGCPSCVGPPIRSEGNRKNAALFTIKMLLNNTIN